ncbi:MAG TPA: alpha/beta fold hydrolase [Anaerolineales bacterium]
MPIPIETELTGFNGWILRTRPAGETPARLVVLVHGLTGDENSMWVFARGLAPSYHVLAPRAPYAAEAGGYSWRPDPDGDLGQPAMQTLTASVDALLGLVDAYAASVNLSAGQFDLVGFSQGAALASLVALMHPDRVRKVGMLAGFVPRGAEGLAAGMPLSGKSIFVAHGTLDTMVPVERARASIRLLEQAGAEVIYCEEEVGHKVSAGCLRALHSYLAS